MDDTLVAVDSDGTLPPMGHDEILTRVRMPSARCGQAGGLATQPQRTPVA